MSDLILRRKAGDSKAFVLALVLRQISSYDVLRLPRHSVLRNCGIALGHTSLLRCVKYCFPIVFEKNRTKSYSYRSASNRARKHDRLIEKVDVVLLPHETAYGSFRDEHKVGPADFTGSPTKCFDSEKSLSFSTGWLRVWQHCDGQTRS